MDTSSILLILGFVLGALGIIFFVLCNLTAEMKYFVISIISFIVAIILFFSVAIILSDGDSNNKKHYKSTNDSSYPEKGYWGDDGYYNPSQAEMQESIREAEEWIKNN